MTPAAREPVAARPYAGHPPMPPSAVRLREFVLALSEVERKAFAARAGVHSMTATRLGYGIPIGASDFFALCAAAGINPVDGTLRARASKPKMLSRELLGAGCALRRQILDMDLRGAAAEAGVSYSTIGRCERGISISVESVLAICAFIGVHPDHYVTGVSHEIGETCR